MPLPRRLLLLTVASAALLCVVADGTAAADSEPVTLTALLSHLTRESDASAALATYLERGGPGSFERDDGACGWLAGCELCEH